jgi:hypothetical protein
MAVTDNSMLRAEKSFFIIIKTKKNQFFYVANKDREAGIKFSEH